MFRGEVIVNDTNLSDEPLSAVLDTKYPYRELQIYILTIQHITNSFA